MPNRPVEHIRDSLVLTGADAEIDLYELTPSGGTGVVRFKSDNDQKWRGNTYTGMPLKLSGEKRTIDSGLSMPTMTIGDQSVDLSAFKPFVYDGNLDNAIIVRRHMLLDNVLNDRLIFEATTYRVKRVSEYGRSRITLVLATASDSLGFSLPYRQYLPPAFPSVQM